MPRNVQYGTCLFVRTQKRIIEIVTKIEILYKVVSELRKQFR